MTKTDAAEINCTKCGKPIQLVTGYGPARWIHVDMYNPDGHEVVPRLKD